MEKIFKVSKFEKNGDKFNFVGFDDYKINFFYQNRKTPHKLIVVVNDYVTNKIINVHNVKDYKTIILLAISKYVNTEDKVYVKNSKYVSRESLKDKLCGYMFKSFFKYIDPINKETSRDVISKLGLTKDIPVDERKKVYEYDGVTCLEKYKKKLPEYIRIAKLEVDDFVSICDKLEKLSNRKLQWLSLIINNRLVCPITLKEVSYLAFEKTKLGTFHFNFYSSDDEMFTIDHIIPKSKGGSVNDFDNLQPMIYYHNFLKSNKLPK